MQKWCAIKSHNVMKQKTQNETFEVKMWWSVSCLYSSCLSFSPHHHFFVSFSPHHHLKRCIVGTNSTSVLHTTRFLEPLWPIRVVGLPKPIPAILGFTTPTVCQQDSSHWHESKSEESLGRSWFTSNLGHFCVWPKFTNRRKISLLTEHYAKKQQHEPQLGFKVYCSSWVDYFTWSKLWRCWDSL